MKNNLYVHKHAIASATPTLGAFQTWVVSLTPCFSKVCQPQGITVGPSNLTRWHNGGFQDYLQQRIRLKEMQSNLDFILDHLRENDGSKIPEAAIQLSSIRVFQFLRDFTDAAGTGISRGSTEFLGAANAACRLSEATNHLKSLKSVTRQSNQVSA